MKISYNWLKEYVDLNNTSPLALADALTNAGLEVEEVIEVACGSNLVIAEVKECYKHPDSDHLQVTKVDYGQGLVQIVCGAPNCRAGIKVIVAKDGAKLKDITIKKASVRGVESNGMLCSLSELGVNEKHLSEEQLAGIEILDDTAPIGCETVLNYLGLDDVVLDVSLTPNRSDCMAMWSVAKEVAAILDRPCTLPSYMGKSDIGKETKLKINSLTNKCPHFLGKIIGKLKVEPSPKWMQDYLHAAGIKAINNVVDISNYVMLETGQPLHFYDLAKMPHQEITVVDNQNIKLTALDGIEYQAKENDLLITTNNVVTGIAGIMGGDDSKIDESTTGIIIEAALFNHVSIRNTAKRLGLMTEASSRFIKGLEPLAQAKAMDRATDLLIEFANASEIEKTVKYGSDNYSEVKVTETLSHCNELLGTNFKMDEVVKVLAALDFKPVVNNDEFTLTIPSYRTDIKIAEDIDEEIIRLIGYDSLVETLPTMKATSGRLSTKQANRRLTKQIFTGLGISEVITYTLVKEACVLGNTMPLENPIALAQPMSEDRKYIRNGLLHSILECASYNNARKNKNINIFEVSNVYGKGLVEERLGLLLSGSLQESKLHKIKTPSDFYTLKGILIEWLNRLGYEGNRVIIKENNIDTNNFHPYRSALIVIQNEVVGIMGQIHPNLSKEYDLDAVVYAEINFDKLLKMKATKIKFEALDRYPAVKRDIAMVVSDETSAFDLIKTIQTSSKLVRNVEIFDVYKGEHVEVGSKSIALSIIYQASDHTLVDDEINKVHANVLAQLENKCKATLRV